jgi:hypothetical protein
MISNERPSPDYRRPYQKPYQPNQGHYQPYGNQQPRPPVQEDSLKTAELEIERKSFRLMLKENLRGRFVRITESNGSKFNSIMVPESGLADFLRVLNEMVAVAGDLQAKAQPVPVPEVPIAAPVAQIQVAPVLEPEPEPAPVTKAKAIKPKATKSKTSTKVKVIRKKAKATRKAKV